MGIGSRVLMDRNVTQAEIFWLRVRSKLELEKRRGEELVACVGVWMCELNERMDREQRNDAASQ